MFSNTGEQVLLACFLTTKENTSFSETVQSLVLHDSLPLYIDATFQQLSSLILAGHHQTHLQMNSQFIFDYVIWTFYFYLFDRDNAVKHIYKLM